MPFDQNLLAAAVSALVGCPVVTHQEYLDSLSSKTSPSTTLLKYNPLNSTDSRNQLQKLTPEIQPLDIEAFHKSVLMSPATSRSTRQAPVIDVTSQSKATQQSGSSQEPQVQLKLGYHSSNGKWESDSMIIAPRSISVFIKTLSGRTITLSVTQRDYIHQLKQQISEKEGVPSEEQRLVYGGKELNDDFVLLDYNIQNESTIHLALRIRGGLSAVYLPDDFLDPAYDFDFTSTDDAGQSFSRGGERYVRPCGWMRFALKVNGKYGPDSWLGSSNAPGEWPVSYHGTSNSNAESIAQVGFKLSKGVHFAYGRGIYSSPNHRIAEQYAQHFSHQGKRYKVIFQNRVNPTNLKKVPDIDYWVSPGDADIRPYGLCIKEF